MFGFNAQGTTPSLSALSSATNPASSAPSTTPAFNFGQPKIGGEVKPTLPAAAPTATAGFSFKFPSSTPSAAPIGGAKPALGLSLSSNSTAASATTTGGLFATPLTVTATSASAAPPLTLKLGAPAPSSTGLTLPGFGIPASTAGGLGGLTAPTSSSTGGLAQLLGGTTSTLGLGGATSTLGLGGTTGTFGLGGTTGTGLLATKPMATPATTTGGLSLGGLGGTTAAVPTTAATATKGLGGVDPATSTQNATKTAGATGDGKRVKEGDMPNELVETVTKLKDYVKEQKEIAAKISAVSCQQMGKIGEQTKSLKHLLSTVAMGLHRNIVALDKLKNQTSQELHNAEMAHRTKETPAGLQYENDAPNQYFYDLLEAFDGRMALYKKLIEDTEGYLVGAQQNCAISPRDLFSCLKRLHETFIALAAQLQGIHEQVKEQKNHYLAYRKVFHNDESDVFAKRKTISSAKSILSRTSQPLGPTPFTGLSNYAAMMMSTAMSQQVAQQQPGAFGALTVPAQPTAATLFGGTNTGTGLFSGSTTALKPAGFSFGATTTTPSAPAFGFPSAGAVGAKPPAFSFGSTATPAVSTGGFGFGTSTTAAKPGFGFGATGFGSTAQPSTGLSAFGNKPLG